MIVVGLGAECNKSVIILNYQLSFINYQYIMKKILPDLIAILAFIILSFAYFFPADIGVSVDGPYKADHYRY